MSGRIHLFLYQGMREKLGEVAADLGLPIEDDTLGSLLQEGIKYVFKLYEEKKLTEAQLAVLKDPKEVITRLERKVRCFLSEGNIRRLRKLEEEWSIDLFDTAHGHIMQSGFQWIYDEYKAGRKENLDMDALKTVYQPHVVYHK